MANQNLGTATLRLNVDQAGLDKGLDKAESKIGKRLGSIGLAAAGFGVTAVVGFAAAAVKSAVDVEKAFGEVRTLLPKISDEAFGKMKNDLMEFQKATGTTSSQAIPALYQAISAGVPADNVMTFMEVASKTAVGGVADLETAVNGLSTVVNTWRRKHYRCTSIRLSIHCCQVRQMCHRRHPCSSTRWQL